MGRGGANIHQLMRLRGKMMKRVTRKNDQSFYETVKKSGRKRGK